MKLHHELLDWTTASQTQQRLWRAENGASAPKRFILADDTLTADSAYKLACEGCGLLWQGDFYNARQLLQALARRCDRPAKPSRKAVKEEGVQLPGQLFNRHRQSQSQRARILGMVLIPLSADYSIPLKRAPLVVEACIEAYGAAGSNDSIVSLRELQALIGAHEWRKKGVFIAELDDHIYPHYGVFSPIRGEYLTLIATTPLPHGAEDLAFDIGTGTGVVAAILARRRIKQIIATDQDPRAIVCATENINKLELNNQVEINCTDLFPAGKAPLIVCNPPWIPARPSAPIEYAIFDPDNRMIKGFLSGLAAHLDKKGEGWLILSDIAEHLELRSRADLLEWIAQGALRVLEKIDVKPTHAKSMDQSDLLYKARAAEITSLWRLGHR